LKPKVIAPKHGPTYVGDGEAALYDLAKAMKEVLAGAGHIPEAQATRCA
jgi:hypothetical protein